MFSVHGAIHHVNKLLRADLFVPEAVHLRFVGSVEVAGLRQGGHYDDLDTGERCLYLRCSGDTVLSPKSAHIHQDQVDGLSCAKGQRQSRVGDGPRKGIAHR